MAHYQPYEPPVEQLLTLGAPDDLPGSMPWADYIRLGVSEADVPELIRMATDKTLHTSDSDTVLVWAPVHAWRALAQLRAAEAVIPLLEQLNEEHLADDDWVLENIPGIFGRIGVEAVAPTAGFLADQNNDRNARGVAVRALQEISERYPECRSVCVDHLSGQLAKFSDDRTLTGFIVASLLDLRAIEAGHIVRAAYEADRVARGIVGWAEAWSELALDDLSEPVPAKRTTAPVIPSDSRSSAARARRRRARRKSRRP